MSLDAAVVLKLGPLALDLALDAAPGETVVLLGPNGAGKTTVLRVIAGLIPLDSGHVVLDGEVLDDPRTGVWTPPE
ncbi:MAG TPA: ATP-binding cassette domain-containing protein, partial [Acidimicrobiia bacterium]|nr:ATP-binding cassette domain-containing protein [Acidimicrobiia bacterium]